MQERVTTSVKLRVLKREACLRKQVILHQPAKLSTTVARAQPELKRSNSKSSFFNFDDVTANDVIQKTQDRQKKARVPIVITDVNH